MLSFLSVLSSLFPTFYLSFSPFLFSFLFLFLPRVVFVVVAAPAPTPAPTPTPAAVECVESVVWNTVNVSGMEWALFCLRPPTNEITIQRQSNGKLLAVELVGHDLSSSSTLPIGELAGFYHFFIYIYIFFSNITGMTRSASLSLSLSLSLMTWR